MKRAFTLIEMLVTVLIILVLITLGNAAVGKVRNKVREVKCQSNQRQLWLETVDYARDYPDPTNFVWTDLRCPSNNLAYAMAGWQDFKRLSLNANHSENVGNDLDVLWSDSYATHRRKNMGVTFNGKIILY